MKEYVSLTMEIFSRARRPGRSARRCEISTPQVIGLTKPSGGGGVNAELIFSSCDTNEVGSFGIQLPITMRPPGFVTRTISLATSKGLGANMAPNTESVRSNEWSPTPCRLHASPSWNLSRREARLGRPPVPGVDEVPGDVDSDDVGAQRAPAEPPSCRLRSRGPGPAAAA